MRQDKLLKTTFGPNRPMGDLHLAAVLKHRHPDRKEFHLSRQGVRKIRLAAETKLRKGLESLAQERGIIP